MPKCDEPDSLRGAVERIIEIGELKLGVSPSDVRALISTVPHTRTRREHDMYRCFATLADREMNRRPLGDGVVDGFYTSARRGRPGEALFVGGVDAMLMHGYPTELVVGLPGESTSRFLGLGNVWKQIEPTAGMRVIDVGCGSGADLGVSAAIAPTGFIVGTDKRADLLPIAAKACPRAALLIADVTSMAITGGVFDVVLANGLPPMQRVSSLGATARALYALAADGGTVSVTVITASPSLRSALLLEFPDENPAYASALATLITGKPTVEDVIAAFEDGGASVRAVQGTNPYRGQVARANTAMFNVLATRP